MFAAGGEVLGGVVADALVGLEGCQCKQDWVGVGEGNGKEGTHAGDECNEFG